MASSLTGKCYDCGGPVEPSPSSSGRPRRYCSDRCRKRAQRSRIRQRVVAARHESPGEKIVRSEPSVVADLFPGPAEERAADILMSAHVLSVAMMDVGAELPPAAGVGFEILGTLLRDKLQELFPLPAGAEARRDENDPAAASRPATGPSVR